MEYVKSRWVEEPIVAPVAFNSAMEYCEPNIPAIGLRMLFGSAAVMTLMTTKWRYFYSRLKQYADLSAADAVETHRKVFGNDRPVLILVDEIAKAKCSENITKNMVSDLGLCLNEDQNIDVIVSSLSPAYIFY
jgi:hypothetical protein